MINDEEVYLQGMDGKLPKWRVNICLKFIYLKNQFVDG